MLVKRMVRKVGREGSNSPRGSGQEVFAEFALVKAVVLLAALGNSEGRPLGSPLRTGEKGNGV